MKHTNKGSINITETLPNMVTNEKQIVFFCRHVVRTGNMLFHRKMVTFKIRTILGALKMAIVEWLVLHRKNLKFCQFCFFLKKLLHRDLR